MSDSPRDELAELARLFAVHVEWQRELGAVVLPVTGVARAPAPAAGGGGGGVAPARTHEPARKPPPAEPLSAVPVSDPASSAVGSATGFELPAFLRRGRAPERPADRPAAPQPAAATTTTTATTATTATTTTTPSAPSPAPAPAPASVPAPPSAAAAPQPAVVASTPRAEESAPSPRRSLALFDADTPSAVESFASGAPLEGDARLRALAEINQAVVGCQRCRLAAGRTQTVFARGNPFAPLAFVGEAPGRDEDLQGRPFVGAAGQLLDRIIAAMGMSEDDVYVANIAKCRPPNNRVPEPDEMAACGPYLAAQLGVVRPEVIVALGRTAANYLLGTGDAMSRIRGKWHTYRGTPLLATWHPAYLLRQPDAKKDTWEDMKKVLEKLGREPPRRGGNGRSGAAE